MDPMGFSELIEFEILFEIIRVQLYNYNYTPIFPFLMAWGVLYI